MKKITACLPPLLLLFTLIGFTAVSHAQDRIDFTPKPLLTTGVENPILNLNGTWSFNAAPGERFFKNPKMKNLSWHDIQVPGEWLMQGFEVKEGTRAAYARSIELPEDWKGKEIRLKCDGVYSLAQVFFNGKLVGSHEGGMTPFELNLTSYAKPGKKNELILAVQSESLADSLGSLTQYAAHQLGGITRKMEIFAVPSTHLEVLHVLTDLDENYKDALLHLEVIINRPTKAVSNDLKLAIILKDPRNPTNTVKKIVSVPPQSQLSGSPFSMSMPVNQPKLWDPEHPNLYEAFVSLEEEGQVLELVRQKIGFRELTVAGNQVFMNGRPIKLRGVNRHEVHPTKGRSLGKEEWETDVRLFKEANVNYIRTSHYPPAEEFITLCDSIGLFVECESPICWVGHGANSKWQSADPHDFRFYKLISQQVRETVAHYRNHPSIIIWSMANESAWGPIWDQVLTEVNDLDPSRPVSFHDQAYGGFNNFGSTRTQIANIHYPGPKGPAIAWKFDRPLLFGEYAHLNTYNRQEIVTDPGVRDAWGRGLESMWENMYYSTGCLGGAIWSGIDDVFYLPSGKAVGYGEWGPIDGWRRTKPEYWHLKKIYSPVKIISRELPLPKPGKPLLIPVENRNLFTNLNEFEIDWTSGRFSGQTSIDLAPGDAAMLAIWMDHQPQGQDALNLSFKSPQGIVVDQFSFSFKSEIEKTDPEPTRIVPELQVLERKASVLLGSTEWIFDAPTGRIRSVVKNNQTILKGGPELVMLPLLTGPCNTEHSLDIEPFNEPCQNWSGRISSTGKEGNKVFVEVEGSYSEADLKLRYEFDTSGRVTINYELTSHVDINPRQIGLVFSMPRMFDQLAWKRKGQWSVYPRNHIGRTSGFATPFPNGMLETDRFGEAPGWSWEEDTHPMGSNDFRATRDNLLEASLTNPNGQGIRLHSDGTGAIRAFVDGDEIHFLGASFSTAGGDLFFSSHLAGERQPLKAGERWKGRMVIEIL